MHTSGVLSSLFMHMTWRQKQEEAQQKQKRAPGRSVCMQVHMKNMWCGVSSQSCMSDLSSSENMWCGVSSQSCMSHLSSSASFWSLESRRRLIRAFEALMERLGDD